MKLESSVDGSASKGNNAVEGVLVAAHGLLGARAAASNANDGNGSASKTNGDTSTNLGGDRTKGLDSLGAAGILDGVAAGLGTNGALIFVGVTTSGGSGREEGEGSGGNNGKLGEHF